VCSIISWGYLAFSSKFPKTTVEYFANKEIAESVLARSLYVTAACAGVSGPFLAQTLLRAVNGALSIRSDKLAGAGNGSIALTYSRNEVSSKKLEEKFGTKELVTQWFRENWYRAVILLAGTVVGATALVIDSVN
jgi:hypothetical protein